MLWLLESGLVAIARLLLYLRLLGQVTNLFPQLTRRLSAGEPHARVRGPCAQFGGMGLEHVQQPLPVAHKKFQKKGSGRGGRSLVGFEFEFDPEKVPGGVSAPRVELSPGVVADAARKSLRDAARADERAEAERRREENLKAVAEERARRGGSMLMHAMESCPMRS